MPEREITLCLVYDEGREPPTAGDAAARLEAYFDGQVALSGASWPIGVLHETGPVLVRPGDAPRLLDAQFARSRLDEEQRMRASRAAHALHVSIAIGDDELPMTALGRGLHLVRPLLDGFVAVFDPAGSSVHPGHWAAAVADAPVPPRPESLFALHAVGDGVGPRWIHTHGLSRLGLPELEALEVPEETAHVVAHVLNAVAARLMLEGVPEPDEVVEWGQGIHAALRPYREVTGLAHTGGTDDERDDAHSFANRVLVIPDGEGWANLATGVERWGEHPVLYRTDWETGRMEALAATRWALFVGLRRVLAPLDDFRFVAKLAYAPEGGFREHLWFDVVDADVDKVTATLLNEPHQDMGMHCGDTSTHDVQRLSDFNIYTPFGAFNPESLPQLAAWVEHQMSRQESS